MKYHYKRSNVVFRYLSGHFVDAYRQAGIDIMQGVDVDDADWGSELQTAAGIAQALIPFSPVSYVAEIPFEPEFQLLTSLFQISRCVAHIMLDSTCYFLFSIVLNSLQGRL